MSLHFSDLRLQWDRLTTQVSNMFLHLTPAAKLSFFWLLLMSLLCATTLWSLMSRPLELTGVFPNTENMSGSRLIPQSVTESEPIRLEWNQFLTAESTALIQTPGQKSSVTLIGGSVTITPQTEWEGSDVTVTLSGGISSVWGATFGTGQTVQFPVRGKAVLDQTSPSEWEEMTLPLVFFHSSKQEVRNVFEEIQKQPNIVTMTPNTLTGSWKLVDPWTLAWESSDELEPNDTIQFTFSWGTTVRNQTFRFRTAEPQLQFVGTQETANNANGTGAQIESLSRPMYGTIRFLSWWPMKQKISFAEVLRCPKRTETHGLEAITTASRENDPLTTTDCIPVPSTLIVDKKDVSITLRTEREQYHLIHFQLWWFDRSGASQTLEYWYGGRLQTNNEPTITDCTGAVCHGSLISLRDIQKDGEHITFRAETKMGQTLTGALIAQEYTNVFGLPNEEITRETAVLEKSILPNNGTYTLTPATDLTTLVLYTTDRADFFIFTIATPRPKSVLISSGTSIEITPATELQTEVTLTGPQGLLWTGTISSGVTLQLVSGSTLASDTNNTAHDPLWSSGATQSIHPIIQTEFAEGSWQIRMQSEKQTHIFSALFSWGVLTQTKRPIWTNTENEGSGVHISIPPFLRNGDITRGQVQIQTANEPIQVEFTGDKDEQWVIAPRQLQTVSFDLTGSTDTQTWSMLTTEGMGESKIQPITLRGWSVTPISSGASLLLQWYDPMTGQEQTKLTRGKLTHMRAIYKTWNAQNTEIELPKIPGAIYGFGPQEWQELPIVLAKNVGKPTVFSTLVRPTFSGTFGLTTQQTIIVQE